MPEPLRRFSEVTLETLDLRVTAIEGGMEAMQLDMANAVREIQSNTRLTEEIHGDTADIREVTADIKVFVKWGKRLTKPAMVLFGLGAATYIYMKTGKWVWPA